MEHLPLDLQHFSANRITSRRASSRHTVKMGPIPASEDSYPAEVLRLLPERLGRASHDLRGIRIHRIALTDDRSAIQVDLSDDYGRVQWLYPSTPGPDDASPPSHHVDLVAHALVEDVLAGDGRIGRDRPTHQTLLIDWRDDDAC